LSEPEPEIQEYALQSLNDLVDQFWAEVSEDITTMCVGLHLGSQ
jgi:26S proteasome regulatory subunit N2